MKNRLFKLGSGLPTAAVTCAVLFMWATASFAVKLPTVPAFEGANDEVLDPTAIPKYVQPLVIPPMMPPSDDPKADYNIAMRQFNQQILPGGIWNTVNGRNDKFPATKVWSYGKAEDPHNLSYTAPMPLSNPKATTFNYPALTVEAIQNQLTRVRWINELFDPKTGKYLPHLLPVDRTLHWANPEQWECKDGSGAHTDCRPAASNGQPLLNPYKGPVPIVTHVHGAHVNPESDGYPEAWWLPAANNIPAGYATQGSFYDQWDRTNTWPGSALYGYYNTQRASTIWYHDHGLGITRLNVYAGPAGFWLLRGDTKPEPDLTGGTLPGPAPALGEDPNFDAAVRAKIREISIAIQGRTFDPMGELYFPNNRAYFEALNHKHKVAVLNIPFFPEDAGSTSDSPSPSDVAPIWNPEFFGNTMVVNGTTWPVFRVAQFPYRLRLLNGTNARTLMLKMVDVNYLNALKRDFNRDGSIEAVPGRPALPFYQIGSDGGLLPNKPVRLAQLLMMPAERADVIVDFTGISDGTEIYIINEGPDEPFGGGAPPFGEGQANPFTTGQVMKFVVDSSLNEADGSSDGSASAPEDLTFTGITALSPDNYRKVSLNEEESIKVCVQEMPDGTIQEIPSVPPAASDSEADIQAFLEACDAAEGFPFGPTAAKVGIVSGNPIDGYSGVPLKWTDNSAGDLIKVFTKENGDPVNVRVTESPDINSTEEWEIWNFTADAHPIHLHLVVFQVVEREGLTPLDDEGVAEQPVRLDGIIIDRESWETGWKDTVIAYPGQVTRIRAKFDVAGLYVWHCHIIDHEDNEMMRPYAVIPDLNGDGCVDTADYAKVVAGSAYDLNGDGVAGDAADATRLTLFYTKEGGASCQ